MRKRRFDDFEVGERTDVGTYRVDAEEIREFAEQYDPQPFHVDEEAAAESHFGGLVASGWHSAAMAMRMLVDEYFGEDGSLGSPGVEQLEWQSPVRPGDRLSLEVAVLEKRELESTDTRGLVTLEVTMLDQDGDQVLSMVANVFFPREQ